MHLGKEPVQAFGHRRVRLPADHADDTEVSQGRRDRGGSSLSEGDEVEGGQARLQPGRQPRVIVTSLPQLSQALLGEITSRSASASTCGAATLAVIPDGIGALGAGLAGLAGFWARGTVVG